MSEWTVIVPAPAVKPDRKPKTGKTFKRKPWLNSNDRDHWRVTSPIRADWRRLAKDAAAAAGLPTGLGRVSITAHVVKERAGANDAMSFCPTAKAIVGGLIDYGMCQDDSNQYVEGPSCMRAAREPPVLPSGSATSPKYPVLRKQVVVVIKASTDCSTRRTDIPHGAATPGPRKGNPRITKPANLADVAIIHREKRLASGAFADADRAYDEALQAFEAAFLRKDSARKDLAPAVTAYETAKAEAG